MDKRCWICGNKAPNNDFAVVPVTSEKRLLGTMLKLGAGKLHDRAYDARDGKLLVCRVCIETLTTIHIALHKHI